jgi:hypothetical protein
MTQVLIYLILSTALVACGGSDKRLKEKTRLEGDTLTSVENSNLAKKADQMEKDLARRHRFYQAVKGDYEGAINSSDGTFKVRITLSPSLAPIVVNRVRQLEEIASDLNNLMLNTKASQWDPGSNYSPVSCIVSDVRPDIEKGEITIVKEGCPNFYSLKIADQGTNATPRTLAARILNGEIHDIQSIEGKIQPATNAKVYTFTAYKVQE